MKAEQIKLRLKQRIEIGDVFEVEIGTGSRQVSQEIRCWLENEITCLPGKKQAMKHCGQCVVMEGEC